MCSLRGELGLDDWEGLNSEGRVIDVVFRGPTWCGRPSGLSRFGGLFAVLHHPAHATHVAHAACCAGSCLLRRLGDDCLGQEDVLSNRRRVL